MTFSVLLVLNTSELLQNIFPFMGKLLLWCIVPCSFIPLCKRKMIGMKRTTLTKPMFGLQTAENDTTHIQIVQI